MKFLKFFLLLWVIFALLDPDPDSESGSTDLIQSGSETLVFGGMARLRSELAFMSSGIGLGFDYITFVVTKIKHNLNKKFVKRFLVSLQQRIKDKEHKNWIIASC